MRAISAELPLTSRGEYELRADLVWLECVRQAILVDRSGESDAVGGLDLEAARLRLELSVVDAQIARIRRELADGVVVADGDPLVSVGCAVRLADETGERTVVIGGLSAANPSSGRLSYESPLARLLLGRRVGDKVEVGAADAARPTRIVAISPMPGPWPLQPESKATGGREAV
jgi:transcription elongation factor GreA